MVLSWFTLSQVQQHVVGRKQIAAAYLVKLNKRSKVQPRKNRGLLSASSHRRFYSSCTYLSLHQRRCRRQQVENLAMIKPTSSKKNKRSSMSHFQFSRMVSGLSMSDYDNDQWTENRESTRVSANVDVSDEQGGIMGSSTSMAFLLENTKSKSHSRRLCTRVRSISNSTISFRKMMRLSSCVWRLDLYRKRGRRSMLFSRATCRQSWEILLTTLIESCAYSGFGGA